MKPKVSLSNLSPALFDADRYEALIARCLTERQSHAMPPRHLANAACLFMQLILTHYDGIAGAFASGQGAELSLKLRLDGSQDELELSYKPVVEVRDTAVATLAAAGSDRGGSQSIPPENAQAEAEGGACRLGYAAFLAGHSPAANPFGSLLEPHLYLAWCDGWNAAGITGSKPEFLSDQLL